MSDWKKLLGSMLEVAEAIAPHVPGGGVAAAVAGKVVDMIDQAKAIEKTVDADEDVMRKLVERRDEIEKSVNAHVDRTVADLRGED